MVRILLEADDDDQLRKELEGRAMDNPALQEAFEKWEDLSRDPNVIREYEARHKAMMDRLAAQAESERRQQVKYEEGRKAEKLAIALDMLADGMPIKAVAKYSKLTIEEVEQLKRNESNRE